MESYKKSFDLIFIRLFYRACTLVISSYNWKVKAWKFFFFRWSEISMFFGNTRPCFLSGKCYWKYIHTVAWWTFVVNMLITHWFHIGNPMITYRQRSVYLSWPPSVLTCLTTFQTSSMVLAISSIIRSQVGISYRYPNKLWAAKNVPRGNVPGIREYFGNILLPLGLVITCRLIRW